MLKITKIRRCGFFRPRVEQLESRSLLASLLVGDLHFVGNNDIPGIEEVSFGGSSIQRMNGTIVVGGAKDFDGDGYSDPAAFFWSPSTGGQVTQLSKPEGHYLLSPSYTSQLPDGTVRFFGHSFGVRSVGGTQRAIYLSLIHI